MVTVVPLFSYFIKDSCQDTSDVHINYVFFNIMFFLLPLSFMFSRCCNEFFFQFCLDRPGEVDITEHRFKPILQIKETKKKSISTDQKRMVIPIPCSRSPFQSGDIYGGTFNVKFNKVRHQG